MSSDSIIWSGTENLTRRERRALVESGEIERVTNGVYMRPDLIDDTRATWAAIALKRPMATLCLRTAAAFHGLTDEIPRSSSVAMPRGTNPHPIQTPLAPVEWFIFDADTFDIGREAHEVAPGISIGLYSAERTVVDMFRQTRSVGREEAIEALRRWLAAPNNQPASLLSMSESFPRGRTALVETLTVLL